MKGTVTFSKSGIKFILLIILSVYISFLNSDDIFSSEKKLQIITRTAPAGIGVVRDRVIVSVNDYILNLTGYSEDELVGKHAIMLYPDKDESDFVGMEKYRQIRERGSGTVETRWLRKDGSICHIILSSTPININDLEEGVIFTALDITDRVDMERELRESESRFKALHEASFGGITIHDKGIIIECNQGLSEITGYSYEELIGMDGLLLISEKSRNMVLEKILSGYEEPYEAIGIRKNGEEYPVRLHARNIPYKGRQVRTVEFRDISTQKKMENRIKRSLYLAISFLFLAILLIMLLKSSVNKLQKTKESLLIKTEELDRFFSSALDLLCITDLNGKFIRANKEWENCLGYSESDLTQHRIYDFIHPDEINTAIESFKSAEKSGRIVSFTNRYLCKDNAYRHIEWRSSIYDKFIYHAARDITERIISEQEVISKNKELEKLIYVASHDLRSPLVNVDGYSKELEYSLKIITNIMEDNNNNSEKIIDLIKIEIPEIFDSLKYIRNSTQQMDLLLKGLLRYSRNGRITLNITAINMNNLLKNIKNSLDFMLKESNALINISDLPECSGDEIQLTQVFLNLINNAVKYKCPDRDSIINISGTKNSSNCIYCVEDNGLGIANEHKDKIFELFYRLDPHREKGEGLGLYIVKQIIERHNGEIFLESILGIGSKFYIKLPIVLKKK